MAYEQFGSEASPAYETQLRQMLIDAEVAFSGVGITPATQRYATRRAADLNELWQHIGFMDEECVIDGEGYWAEPNVAGLSRHQALLVASQAGGPDFKSATGQVKNAHVVSRGFNFGDLRGEGWLQPYHQLDVLESSTPDLKAGESLNVLWRGSSIAPVEPLEAPFVGSPDKLLSYMSGRGRERDLHKASDDVARSLCTETFWRKSPEQRIELADMWIKQAEDTFRLVGAGVVARSVTFMRVPRLRTGGDIVQERITTEKSQQFFGLCLGATVTGRQHLASLNAGRRRNPNTGEGLSIIVELNGNPELAAQGVNRKSIVEIPLSKQAVKLQLA